MEEEHVDSSMEELDYNEEWLYLLRICDLKGAIDLLRERLVTDIYYKNEDGSTALHYVCANNLPEAIVFLLKECKFDYCLYNNSGNTPLQWAIQTNSRLSIEQLLIHDYRIHESEYSKLPENDFLKIVEEYKLNDEHKLDEDTRRHYNLLEYPKDYKERNVIDLLRQNSFGRSPLSDAFNVKDLYLLQIILEHPIAAVLDQQSNDALHKAKPSEPDVDAASKPLSVVHQMSLNGGHPGGPVVKVRELEIRGGSILDAEDPSRDTSGEIVWESSIVASHWYSLLLQDGQFTNQTVLELGAGCGLCGISLLLNAKHQNLELKDLVISDYSEETMENLTYNLSLNRIEHAKTRQINWYDERTWPKETFDRIIGSDLVYDSKLATPLSNVVAKLLSSPDGSFFYAFKSSRDGAELLLQELEEKGLKLELQEVPKEFLVNPLIDKSESVGYTFFPDLQCDDFMLLHAKWH